MTANLVKSPNILELYRESNSRPVGVRSTPKGNLSSSLPTRRWKVGPALVVQTKSRRCLLKLPGFLTEASQRLVDIPNGGLRQPLYRVGLFRKGSYESRRNGEDNYFK